MTDTNLPIVLRTDNDLYIRMKWCLTDGGGTTMNRLWPPPQTALWSI